MTELLSNGMRYAERVTEHRIGGIRLLTLPTAVDDVVSMYGSVYAHPNVEKGDRLVQSLTVSLLDKGTERRDRFELARVLEDRGASLNIHSDGLRVVFSAQALTKDVPTVVEILAEVLREPTFEPDEFDKARSRLAAQLQRNMESTSEQAQAALDRSLYPKGHPNYSPPSADQLQRLQQISLQDVRDYHRTHFGANEVRLAAVGDIDQTALRGALERHLQDWERVEISPAFDDAAGRRSPRRVGVQMDGKQNLDVCMGHVLDIHPRDDDYIPLYVGNYILGGNFSARLMTEVRDTHGLTYGIGSALSDVETDYNGHWQIQVTLSGEYLDAGIEATVDEVRRFVEEGVTTDEVDDKKTTLTGSFKVGLASTSSLARTLLRNAERGFEVDYLDRYPALVRELDVDTVNEAVYRHLDPEALHTTIAGTLPEGFSVDHQEQIVASGRTAHPTGG